MSMNPTEFVASLTNDKCDPILGAKVEEHLRKLGLERGIPSRYDPFEAYVALSQGIHSAYYYLGLDIENDLSIKDTPKRFAKMFVGELTKGLNYNFFPKCTSVPNGNVAADSVLESGLIRQTAGAYNQMVLVRQIRTTSLCEHHLQTIDGFTHIAYIPKTQVIGLSKLARVIEFFAARPQIQERMTEQIFAALSFILETQDVAVFQDCVHFCMRARGAKQPESRTTTSKMGGRFMNVPELREEFFHAING